MIELYLINDEESLNKKICESKIFPKLDEELNFRFSKHKEYRNFLLNQKEYLKIFSEFNPISKYNIFDFPDKPGYKIKFINTGYGDYIIEDKISIKYLSSEVFTNKIKNYENYKELYDKESEILSYDICSIKRDRPSNSKKRLNYLSELYKIYESKSKEIYDDIRTTKFFLHREYDYKLKLLNEKLNSNIKKFFIYKGNIFKLIDFEILDVNNEMKNIDKLAVKFYVYKIDVKNFIFIKTNIYTIYSEIEHMFDLIIPEFVLKPKN